MDGSFFVFLANHPAATTFALMGVTGIGFALWRHTDSCKKSREKLHGSIDKNTAMLAEVRERLSAVEATNSVNHMREMQTLLAGLKPNNE